MQLCDYGCGLEAKYQFKNGKWCCSEFWTQCPVSRKIVSESNKEVKRKSLSIKHKKNISEAKKGIVFSQEWKNKLSISAYKRKPFSKEHRENISEAKKEKYGEKSSNWKGGDYNWLHKKAKRLFGRDTCEVCGMTNEEHIEKVGCSLHIHCDGKRYHNMERIFWTTCCIWCHKKIEALDKEE